jgi:hypothetical protein
MAGWSFCAGNILHLLLVLLLQQDHVLQYLCTTAGFLLYLVLLRLLSQTASTLLILLLLLLPVLVRVRTTGHLLILLLLVLVLLLLLLLLLLLSPGLNSCRCAADVSCRYVHLIICHAITQELHEHGHTVAWPAASHGAACLGGIRCLCVQWHGGRHCCCCKYRGCWWRIHTLLQ